MRAHKHFSGSETSLCIKIFYMHAFKNYQKIVKQTNICLFFGIIILKKLNSVHINYTRSTEIQIKKEK